MYTPTSVKKTLNLSGKFDIYASGKLSQPEEIFYVANIVNAIIIICINTCMPGSRPGCPSVKTKLVFYARRTFYEHFLLGLAVMQNLFQIHFVISSLLFRTARG